jgi:PII-like signaling protein
MTMKGLEGEMLLVRIFVKESDHFEGRPLYLALLKVLQDAGIRGGTALRGIAGFGAHTEMHTDRILRLSHDLPVVVEAVDEEERIRAVLPQLDGMIGSGLITFERAHVIRYLHPRKGGGGPGA